MTNEEKFILKLNEIGDYNFPFTIEMFRKQFNLSKLDMSLLSKIIDSSFNNNNDIIPTLIQIFDEIKNDKFTISTANISTICNKLKENIKNITLTDNDIITFCTITSKYNNNKDTSHINSQLGLALVIEDKLLKENTIKLVFKNLLEIKNNTKNQKFIVKFWESINKDISEIIDIVPLILNNNPSILERTQEFHTIDINCNKIGQSFKEKPIHSFNSSKKLISKFNNTFPDEIIFSKENKNTNCLFLIMKNKESSEKLHTIIDFFMHKIHQEKSWYSPNEVDTIIRNNWNSILLSDKLTKELNTTKRSRTIKI